MGHTIWQTIAVSSMSIEYQRGKETLERGITHIVAFVNENKEEIETRHDWCGHSDILTKGPRSIVSATDRVGSRQDRCARIQGCLYARLGD